MCWISTRSLRSEQASRLLRRVTLPDGGRETYALAPKAWTSAALRLRVRAQGYAQHLCVLRAQERMAASGHYRATYGGGFRLGYVAAGGRALSTSREGAGGPRQPKHSQPGLVVQGVRAGGSQAPVAPAGVPPHPQARLLAEHGGDRALGALSAVFGASHPRCREAYTVPG